MKKIITIQTGYTKSRLYSVTNKFYTTIIIDGEDFKYINYKGLYGVNERVEKFLIEKGFEKQYIYSEYGVVKEKDVKHFSDENEVFEILKNLFN